MTGRLNILFLASWYPNRTHTTLGNFIQRHAEAIATIHNVHVLYVAADKSITGPSEIVDFKKNGVNTTIIYYRKRFPGFLSSRKAFSDGIVHLQQKDQFDFDIVHLNVIWPAGWQALYLKSNYALPFIITEHWTGYDIDERKKPGFSASLLIRQVARKADMLCPVTKNLAELMQRFGLKGNYTVIPNVVDTNVFVPGEKPMERTNFLHVSSLVEKHKNIQGILRSWKKAVRTCSSIHLTIGGDGPWEAAQQYAQEIGIPDNTISFFGEKSEAEIAELMKESHVILLFSNYENLPCVVIEGLSSGMAVIATDVGGIREHVTKERGYLLPKKNEIALAEVICRYAEQNTKFNPALLRKYAVENFSVTTVADQYARVYEKILSQ